MARYNTVQRTELVGFLRRNSDKALTISEIAAAMQRDECITKPPAESTVYRLVKQLVSEGCIKRTVNGNSREFLYQLTDSRECGGHLHMKCSVCGELLHMHNESSEKLAEELLESEGFALDKSMVLTGVCGKCRSSE